MIKVLALSQGLSGAIPWYRVSQPLRWLQQKGLVDVDFLDSRVDLTPVTKKLEWCDVAILQCRTDWKSAALVEAFQSTYPDKIIVAEYDDNIFDISPWNEKFVTLGEREVKLTIDPKDKEMFTAYKKAAEEQDMNPNILPDGKLEAYLWKDGQKGFHLEQNIDRMTAARKTIQSADLLTVTTKELAKKLESHCDRSGPIAIMPNLIDFDYWKPQKPNKGPKLRICWQGGSSHYGDWKMVSQALLELQKHIDYTLVIAGQKFDGRLKDIKDIEFIPWHGDIRTYPLMMRELKADIGIIPLEDNSFNKGKSELKWLEYSALKIPSVVSDVTPYKEVIKHGKTGLLAKNTTQDWLNNLLKLANDKDLRKTLAEKACTRVKLKHSTERSMELYEAYDTVLKIKRKANTLKKLKVDN